LPYGKPDTMKWYAVDGAALRAAPSAAAYSAGALDTKTRKWMVWQVGGAIALLLLAIIWLLIPKGGTHSVVALMQGASVNGAPLTVWPIQKLVLTRAHGDTTTVPISATRPSPGQMASRLPHRLTGAARPCGRSVSVFRAPCSPM
jgi:hypothetical protein